MGSWLHQAASFGQREIVEWLIDRGLDVNVQGGILEGGPLSEAAEEGHLSTMQCLIDHGAAFDTSSATLNPLFTAIAARQAEAAQLLIKSGIDTTPVYTIGGAHEMDAREFARHWGLAEVIELLDAKGAE